MTLMEGEVVVFRLVHRKCSKGVGYQMPKVLKESVKLNWNFLSSGEGILTKKPGEGDAYFSNNHGYRLFSCDVIIF